MRRADRTRSPFPTPDRGSDRRSPRRGLVRSLAFGLFLSACAVSSPGRAQDIATAEALFDKGVADMKAGRYEAGCKAIGESQRLDPRPGTLFVLAGCEAEWGHIATAVTRYADYIALYERLPPAKKAESRQAERYKFAQDARAKLLPEVPLLTITLPPGAPTGIVVTRDDAVMAEATLGVALPLDPGEHTIATETADGARWEQKLTLARGEKKAVTLEIPAPPRSAPTATASVAPTGTATATGSNTQSVEPPPPGRSYAVPIAAFAAGAVGLGVGAVFGGLALSNKGGLDEVCSNKDCPTSEAARIDQTKLLSHVSTAGFALAGVGVALGVTLLILKVPAAKAPAKSASPLTLSVAGGPSQVRLEGRF